MGNRNLLVASNKFDREKGGLLNRRVVITGLGLITPIGIGKEQTWDSLCAGRSGAGEITRFDTSNFQTKIAAEVKGFKSTDFMPQKDAKRVEPFGILLLPMPWRQPAWPSMTPDW